LLYETGQFASFRSFAAIQTSVIGSSHSPKEKVVPLSATDIPDYPHQEINEGINACPTLG
jgi:hypothetical protein